jgi:hypothetical protein
LAEEPDVDSTIYLFRGRHATVQDSPLCVHVEKINILEM